MRSAFVWTKSEWWRALAQRLVAPFDERKAGDIADDAREQRERLWQWQAGTVGISAGLVLYVLLWQPIQQSDFGNPRFHAGLIFLPLLALGAQAALQSAITASGKTPSRFIASAIALPLAIVAAWLVEFRPMHADFDAASQAFDRYTVQAPTGGALHDRFIDFRDGGQVGICAEEGPSTRVRWDAQCIGVDTDAAPSDQVYGGYRLSSDRTRFQLIGVDGQPSEEPEPYDCFGAIGCAR